METKFNQLRLGNRICLFEYKDVEYFYAMVLNAWRGEYPDGRIDYMRFMMDWSRLSGEEIFEIMNDLYSIYDGPSWVNNTLIIVNWNSPGVCRNMLADLMNHLTIAVNPKPCFDRKAFDKAFDRVFHL